MKYSMMTRISDRSYAVCAERFQVSSGHKEPLGFVSVEFRGAHWWLLETYLESTFSFLSNTCEVLIGYLTWVVFPCVYLNLECTKGLCWMLQLVQAW